ncbi:MAG: thiamine pyrophosphate-dependent enzyme [Bryobacteraceae bacterium]
MNLARRVLELRLWQHLINEDLKRNRFRIPVHVAMGHEAIAVAVDEAMGPRDALLLTHRNIAYNLARTRAFEPVREHYLSGPLGSMNLANPEAGIVYSSSILGNNLPVACGVAWADRVAGRDAAAWVLTGDGAMEEGSFWESLVFARSHALPVIFLVENNDHSLASRIEERRCAIDLAGLCGAAGVPFTALAGNHADRYREQLGALREQATNGPVCAEVKLKTLTNHAGATPGWAADPKKISLEAGLVVEETELDPAWVARGSFDADDYASALSSLLELAIRLSPEVECPATSKV